MGRQRSPNRDKAKEMWEQDPKLTTKDIAAELQVSEDQVRKWKSLDKWEKNKVTVVTKNGTVTNQRTIDRVLAEKVQENEELTEKEKLFCLHYVRTFNGSASVIRAGFSAKHARKYAYDLLQRPRVQAEIKRLKSLRIALDFMADKNDLIDLYMRIAFADISDYVEFGVEDRVLMGDMGPIKVLDEETGEEKELTYTANYVRFREADNVDGQIISEVKLGRDGASLKLADRMRAADKLDKYFELFPQDKRKALYETQKLKIEKERFEMDKAKAEGEDGNKIADEWIAGLMGDGADEE